MNCSEASHWSEDVEQPDAIKGRLPWASKYHKTWRNNKIMKNYQETLTWTASISSFHQAFSRLLSRTCNARHVQSIAHSKENHHQRQSKSHQQSSNTRTERDICLPLQALRIVGDEKVFGCEKTPTFPLPVAHFSGYTRLDSPFYYGVGSLQWL